MDKKENRRFDKEEGPRSSSAADMNFISDYFAWCIYKFKRKRKEEQQEEEYNAYIE
jgi:hypothetical protein